MSFCPWVKVNVPILRKTLRTHSLKNLNIVVGVHDCFGK